MIAFGGGAGNRQRSSGAALYGIRTDAPVRIPSRRMPAIEGKAMRTVIRHTGWALALLLAASTGWAQPGAARPADEGSVQRLEIYNGPMRSVYYVPTGTVSPSEAASLRDLERAENDVALAGELQALRLKYVRNASLLENRMSEVNRLLYGYSSETSGGWTGASGFFGYAGAGPYGVTNGYFYPGYGISGPYASAYPFGYGYPGGVVGYAGTNVGSNSLAYGIGSQGVVKDVVASTLRDALAPDFAVGANHELSAAWSNASHSAAFRKGAGLKEPIALAAQAGPESRFGVKPGDEVTVNYRLGNKTEQATGKVRAENAEFLTIDTSKGEEMIRSSEITNLVKPKK
jgi:hypothetical protein